MSDTSVSSPNDSIITASSTTSTPTSATTSSSPTFLSQVYQVMKNITASYEPHKETCDPAITDLISVIQSVQKTLLRMDQQLLATEIHIITAVECILDLIRDCELFLTSVYDGTYPNPLNNDTPISQSSTTDTSSSPSPTPTPTSSSSSLPDSSTDIYGGQCPVEQKKHELNGKIPTMQQEAELLKLSFHGILVNLDTVMDMYQTCPCGGTGMGHLPHKRKSYRVTLDDFECSKKKIQRYVKNTSNPNDESWFKHDPPSIINVTNPMQIISPSRTTSTSTCDLELQYWCGHNTQDLTILNGGEISTIPGSTGWLSHRELFSKYQLIMTLDGNMNTIQQIKICEYHEEQKQTPPSILRGLSEGDHRLLLSITDPYGIVLKTYELMIPISSHDVGPNHVVVYVVRLIGIGNNVDDEKYMNLSITHSDIQLMGYRSNIRNAQDSCCIT